MNNMVEILDSIIKKFKEEMELEEKNIFEVFSLSQIYKNKDIDIEDIYECIVDGGNDGGIDSIVFFVDDKIIKTAEEVKDLQLTRKSEVEINIIQSKKTTNIRESIFEKLLITLTDILDMSKELESFSRVYNPELLDKIFVMRKLIEHSSMETSNIKIKVMYICIGNTEETSDGVKRKMENLKYDIRRKFSISSCVDTKIYGASELRSLYLAPEETELTLKTQKSVNSVFLDEQNVAYLALVKLNDYFEFITDDNGKIRENIFESNVRHFQGGVTVNKNIKDSLSNNKDIEFWWLNNGVTMIVNEIVSLPTEKLRLTNTQIVNGLQTTFCIYDIIKENKDLVDERSIMIKILKVNNDSHIDKIISATNSQTEVRAAELRATEELQRDIENYFISKGFYYDRRKNYYKNKGKKRNKIFTIAKTAQYIETILFKSPNNAKSNPTSLLKSDTNYKRIFNKNIKIEAYLKGCLVYRTTENYIKDIIVDDPIQKKYSVSVRNFSFHMMLLNVCFALKKYRIEDSDLANIDMNLFNIEVFDNAMKFLERVLEEYTTERPNENIINIAKSKSFTEFMNKGLENEFINNNEYKNI